MLKFILAVGLPVFVLSVSVSAQAVKQPVSIVRGLTSMPLAFAENHGQWDERVRFRANANGATMWFTSEGAYYQFTRRVPNEVSKHLVGRNPRGFDGHGDSTESLTIKASFLGASPHPRLIGHDLMEYRCNYFIGNDPAKWRTDVPNFRAMVYEDIYDGIDLKYYGNGKQMEYDFIVSPGADPSRIMVRYEGARSVSVNDSGQLVVETEWGEVVEQRPIVYQIENGESVPVECEYVLLDVGTFGFFMPRGYKQELALVIDPVLSYSTYLGGSAAEECYGITVDTFGAAYVTGVTVSTDFPTKDPYQTDQGDNDVVVTKLSASGSSLVYSTYLGGDSDDYGYGIAMSGGSSAACVAGYTLSTDFPTAGPYQTDQTGYDGFVTKLGIYGNTLIYSTYLGGNAADRCTGIAVDVFGKAYVTGYTSSTDFPTESPYQTDQVGPDAFVAKLAALGASLDYSTYLGGGGDDCGLAIALDGVGSAYVTGYTSSTDFPTENPYQLDQLVVDAFVAKLDSSGSTLFYSTYLGGNGEDRGLAIAADGTGAACVTGWTSSTDFPTESPYQTDQSGTDAFVTKFHSSGGSLIYSTYLGGDGLDRAEGVAIDESGAAYITGITGSTDFPTLNPHQMDQTADDVFVTKLRSPGGSLAYSTYMGGSGNDGGLGIAVDGDGAAYVTGYTASNDFPTVNPYQPDQLNSDAFVFKLAFVPDIAFPVSPSQNQLNVPVDADISVVFDTDMDGFSFNDTTIAVHGSISGRHFCAYAYYTQIRTLEIWLDEDFAVGEVVTVTLTTGIESASGVPLSAPFVWSFTVEVLGGEGGLRADSVFEHGTAPFGVAIADFNGDGSLDIANSNFFDQDVTVVFNNGDGTFGPATSYPAGNWAQHICCGDLDNDGDVDIAAVVWHVGVVVWLNTGNGTFDPGAEYDAVSDYASVATADLNGDGYLDLISGASGAVRVWLNNGNGTFASGIGYAQGDYYAQSVITGDFDNDGDLDVSTAYISDSIAVLVNDGSAGFDSVVAYQAGDTTSDGPGPHVADLDGDGWLDLIVPTYEDDSVVTILLNAGNGEFVPGVDYVCGANSFSVSAADIDDDNDLDLLVRTFALSLLKNAGDATFAPYVPCTTWCPPGVIKSADFDNDGDVDIAWASCGGWIAFNEPDADGDSRPDSLDNCPTTYNPGQSDIDGDGIGDVCDPYCDLVPDLVSPPDWDTLEAPGTFIWTSVCDFNLFQIVLSSDPTLADTNAIVWSAYAADTSKTYNGPALDRGQFYYWSVRDFRDTMWASYVTPHTIYLPQPLDTLIAPQLLFPSEGATVALPESFTWTSVTGAARYRFEIVPDTSGDSVILAGEAPGTLVRVPDLEALLNGSTYFWRVAAVDSNDFRGHFSGFGSFMVGSSVDVPEPPTPSPPDTSVTGVLRFHWSDVDGTSTYRLNYGTDATFTDPGKTILVTGITDTTYGVPSPENRTIHWRVKACNSAGCSNWAIGDSIIVEAGDCISNVHIIVSNDTTEVDQYSDLSFTGIVAGNCDNPVSGNWYVDDSITSSYSRDSISGSIIVTSSLLATNDTGVFTVALDAVVGIDTAVAETIYYHVVAPSADAASQLIISASRTSLPSDGVSTSDITVIVADALGNRVYSDSGRQIDLALTGSGSLDQTFDSTQQGAVSFQYTAGATPDTVSLVATSSGLTGDSLNIILFLTPLDQLKGKFISLMAVLDGLRLNYVSGTPMVSTQYATSGLWDFYDTRIDIPSPAPIDIAVFRRAVAALEIVLEHYDHPDGPLFDYDNDFTATYGQDASWNDVLSSVQYMTTPVLTAADLGFGTVDAFPDEFQPIARQVLRDLHNRMTNRINAVALQLDQFGQAALQLSAQPIATATKDSIFGGSNPYMILTDSAILHDASDSTMSFYLGWTQGIIDTILYWTTNGLVNGDYVARVQLVDSMLPLLKANGALVQADYEALDLLSASGAYLDLLDASPADPAGRLSYVVDIANQVLHDGAYRNGTSHPAEFAGNILEGMLEFTSLPFGDTVLSRPFGADGERQVLAGGRRIDLAPVNVAFVQQRLAFAQRDVADYETLVREFLAKLEAQDYSDMWSDINGILVHSQVLSQDFSNLLGIVYASAYDATIGLPEYREVYDHLNGMYDSCLEAMSDLNLINGFYAIDTGRNTAVYMVEGAADHAIQATGGLQTEFDDVLGQLLSLDAAPTLIVSQLDIPDVIYAIDTGYTMGAWITNVGSVIAEQSAIAIVGDIVTAIDTGGTSQVFSLDPGDSVYFEFGVTFGAPQTRGGYSEGWGSFSVTPSCENGLSVQTSVALDYVIGCCEGIRGNVDSDSLDNCNIVDLTYLVAYLFGGGDEPECPDEANVNADGIEEPIVNIVDLTYIVAYLFGGGAPPEPCP